MFKVVSVESNQGCHEIFTCSLGLEKLLHSGTDVRKILDLFVKFHDFPKTFSTTHPLFPWLFQKFQNFFKFQIFHAHGSATDSYLWFCVCFVCDRRLELTNNGKLALNDWKIIQKHLSVTVRDHAEFNFRYFLPRPLPTPILSPKLSTFHLENLHPECSRQDKTRFPILKKIIQNNMYRICIG